MDNLETTQNTVETTTEQDLARMIELRSAEDITEEWQAEFSQLHERLISNLLPLVEQMIQAGLLSIALYAEDGEVSSYLRRRYYYAGFDIERIVLNGNINLCAGGNASSMLAQDGIDKDTQQLRRKLPRSRGLSHRQAKRHGRRS